MAEYEIPKFLRVPIEEGLPPKSMGVIKSVYKGKANGLTRAEFRAKKGAKSARTLDDVKARIIASIDRHIAWARSTNREAPSKWVSRRGDGYYISMKLGVVDISINGAEVFGPVRKSDLADEFIDMKELVRSGDLDQDISQAWSRVRNTGKSRKVPRGFYRTVAKLRFGGNETRCRNYYKVNRDEKWLDVARFERGEFG